MSSSNNFKILKEIQIDIKDSKIDGNFSKLSLKLDKISDILCKIVDVNYVEFEINVLDMKNDIDLVNGIIVKESLKFSNENYTKVTNNISNL